MKLSIYRPLLLAVVAVIATAASAQNKPNQTLGYGDGELLTFTYTQSFDCVDQPNADLNFNGIPAAQDPGEMQIPICQVGTQPTINPPGQKGNPGATTEPIYVLVPMFSTDNDQKPDDAISCSKVVPGTLCGRKLGSCFDQPVWRSPRSLQSKTGRLYPVPGTGRGSWDVHHARLPA